MTGLPNSWTVATLHEITTECVQRIPAPDEAFEYIDIGSVDREKKRIIAPEKLVGATAPSRARKGVRTGDVIVSMTRPNLNAVALIPPELDGQIASTGFDVLRASSIDPRWIFYSVRTDAFVEKMSELVQGALYPAVRSKDVRGFRVPLAPLSEQKRIADKLDALLARVDACRDHLDRVPGILKRFRQSVLAAATSGELTREWREEAVANEARKTIAFDDDALVIPSSWDVATLSELLSTDRPLCYGVVQPGDASPDGPSLIRVQDLSNGGIDIDNLRTVSNAVDREYQRSRVQGGDVLISVVGTIGRVAIVPAGFEGNIARAIARLVCGPRIEPEWMRYWLECSIVQWWLVRSSREVARKTLNLSELATIRVAVPTLLEQAEIVRRTKQLLSYAAQLEVRLASADKRLYATSRSLLTKAFQGDLVPQDPSDEPASTLLERIRVRRNSRGKTSATANGDTRKTRTIPERNTVMLTRKDISPTHLATILKERGSLTAEALWYASQLAIDDFYDQLKDEESRGFLCENHGDSPQTPRLLVPTA
jgi:type I restriction enzyme, S subunit